MEDTGGRQWYQRDHRARVMAAPTSAGPSTAGRGPQCLRGCTEKEALVPDEGQRWFNQVQRAQRLGRRPSAHRISFATPDTDGGFGMKMQENTKWCLDSQYEWWNKND